VGRRIANIDEILGVKRGKRISSLIFVSEKRGIQGKKRAPFCRPDARRRGGGRE